MALAADELGNVSSAENISSQTSELTYFHTLLYAGIVGAAGELVAQFTILCWSTCWNLFEKLAESLF
jgi:hypothetical protein